MQKVTILCVGKLKERFYMDAAAEKYIKNALKAHGGALRDTAKALGLTTQMLRYNMEKYGIQRP